MFYKTMQNAHILTFRFSLVAKQRERRPYSEMKGGVHVFVEYSEMLKYQQHISKARKAFCLDSFSISVLNLVNDDA